MFCRFYETRFNPQLAALPFAGCHNYYRFSERFLLSLRIPAYEYKRAHHSSTSTSCSTVSASLYLFEEGRSSALRPIAMESAALAFKKPRCLLRTSPRQCFRNYRDPSARKRVGLDVALVSTSSQTALRKS